ncbi:MAG TPA: hypothetical protein DIW81_05880 [Planctomycetaceae bacterium]|nr:hypothetical protein [Rubinisphaera sp.]HCS51112.1 hypothetical protein [Planctomycetaceae bacterium]|tara:strand:+ start:328 stop:594 length:267 start_codon:yes stop_codon:yes gene_type:complete
MKSALNYIDIEPQINADANNLRPSAFICGSNYQKSGMRVCDPVKLSHFAFRFPQWFGTEALIVYNTDGVLFQLENRVALALPVHGNPQ